MIITANISRPLWIEDTDCPSHATRTMDVINPATEELLATISIADEVDVVHAGETAHHVFPSWAAMGPSQRKEMPREVGQKIRAQEDDIARLLRLENSKPLAQAKAEVRGATTLIEEYVELAVHFRSGVQGSKEGELVMQRWEPRGITACIVPWNFPLQLCMEPVAPNLTIGNTVVLKPSEKTPLATRFLVTQCVEHLPSGVCNLLLGDGITTGACLTKHPGIETIMFIGSVHTGRAIGQVAESTAKRAILELGGKDPLIIDEIVNVDLVTCFAADACCANTGQICTSSKRIYVHRSIFDRSVTQLVASVQAYKVGNGLELDVQMGSLIDHLQLQKVEEHVHDAVIHGATVLGGGQRLGSCGFFFPPTVMINVNHKMLLMREEAFEPIAPVMPFDDFDEAITLANDSDYGLAGIVYIASAPRVMKAFEKLKVGMLKINAERGKAPGAISESFNASGLGAGYGMEVLPGLTR